MAANEPERSRQRIDKWLWHARVARTRTAAANIVTSGKVRIDSKRITRASHQVQVGQVVTAPQGNHIRVLEITGLTARRISAAETELLYLDRSPPIAKSDNGDQPARSLLQATREAGSGRPTKRERRLTDRLRGQN